jgi:hypothetical protein
MTWTTLGLPLKKSSLPVDAIVKVSWLPSGCVTRMLGERAVPHVLVYWIDDVETLTVQHWGLVGKSIYKKVTTAIPFGGAEFAVCVPTKRLNNIRQHRRR